MIITISLGIKLVVLAGLGLCVGSFLNVVIYRLPIILEASWREDSREFLGLKNESTAKFNLAFPLSHCPKCKKKLKWWHNVPVFSFILLGAKCYYCKAKIALRYPLVELLTCLLYILAGMVFNSELHLLASLVFIGIIICLSLIDLDYLLLPDELTISLLWLGLIVNLNGIGFANSLKLAVLGAIIGYLILWLIYWGFKLLTHKEGMGYGDFKLLAALGAWFGADKLIILLLISSLGGIIYGLVLKGLKNKSAQIPFGPALSLAGLCLLFLPSGWLWF